jgi:protein SCO1/2
MTADRATRLLLVLALALVLGAVACGSGAAQPVPAPAPSAPPAEPAQRDEALVAPRFPDVVLVNQRGEPVHVHRDLVQDKIVVMNFIYTRCTSVCPTLGVSFSRLQELEKERLGREVNLISVTIDPENDTPERLLAWGERYHAAPGWTMLGGAPRDVERLLEALSVYTAVKESHVPIVLAGNDRTGQWRRAHGFTTPAQLHELVDQLRAGAPAR